MRFLLPFICRGVLLFLLLVFGCALPDLQPFADSTAQLHTAVLQTTTAVQLTLLKAGASDAAEQLGHEMAVRVIAMQAIVRYTDALSHIAEAGRMGGENAGMDFPQTLVS